MSKFWAEQWIDYVNRRETKPDELTRLRAENARLRAALEACAENLELQLARRSMPCESASPKSDADSFGGTRALMDARAALAGKGQG